jgi:hypothetical protein
MELPGSGPAEASVASRDRHIQSCLVATPSAGLPHVNVKYDLGRGTEQMTNGPISRLVTCWELARTTPCSTWGIRVNFCSTWCEAVELATR